VAYMYRGEYDRAIEHLSRTSSVTPGSAGHLGQIYAFSGKRAEALAEIDRLIDLSKSHNVAAHDIASIYAALGDADNTFLWLDRAFEDRSQLLGWIRWNPAFDSVRGDPRYAEFMRRLNLN
jgi:tetratricopeptide (TPR) repeat protein